MLANPCALLGAWLLVAPLVSPLRQPAPSNQSSTPSAQQQKPDQPPPQEEKPVYEEQVVVTASKVEQALVNAPATVTLINSQTIENSPATNYADLLRAVPGLNVTQTSARDINLTSRAATGTLSTSQLALVDGRTIYQDFFGFVAWDFLPINPSEIKQIEVIRGPASAVWGANALTGVVNVITKSPREMQGSTFTAERRRVRPRRQRASNAATARSSAISASHAAAVNDRWAYKVSAGFYHAGRAGAADRPDSRTAPARSYPDFANQGTSQPKFDGASTTTSPEDGRRSSSPAASRAPKASSTPASAPSTSTAARYLAYGKMNYSRGATEGEHVRQPPRRRRHEPAGGRRRRPAAAVPLQEHDLRRRSRAT